MSDYRHRCTTAGCPYLGQLTDNLSCGCHRKHAEIMKAELARLTTPRPISEYHEDMGPVLWWRWEQAKPTKLIPVPPPGRWAGEPPYVGTPNDLGFTVEAHTTTRIITQANQEHDPEPVIHRIDAGGWPGYHTHFTPIPLPEAP